MTNFPTMPSQTYRRKLIEVDLPLDAINKESAREKIGSSKKGHPATMHRWWARRPLAACRAIAFATVVDDPSEFTDEFPNPIDQERERDRLHAIISGLANVEAGTSDATIEVAQMEIAKSLARSKGLTPPTNVALALDYIRDQGPTIYDPFCGGGSIPFEAQRLGLKTKSIDLNPVAVLITKALVELSFPFLNQQPINPLSQRIQTDWHAATGIADDIRYFGNILRDRAENEIGNLYPRVPNRNSQPKKAYAWIWFRTIECPNPACAVEMPLTKSFQLSSKRRNEHWVKPVLEPHSRKLKYNVQDNSVGVPISGTVNRRNAICIICETSVPISTIRQLGLQKRIKDTLIATVVADGQTRVFLEPDDSQIEAAINALPTWKPTGALPAKALSIRPQLYGYKNWSDLFSNRQLAFLTNMANQISLFIAGDSEFSVIDEKRRKTIGSYLTLAIGRLADYFSTFNYWYPATCQTDKIFGRQGIAMVWNYGEVNPFAGGPRDWNAHVGWVADVIERLPNAASQGIVDQADAATAYDTEDGLVLFTDPPYYDNIHYADSSDFFYVWHRAILRNVYPSIILIVVNTKIRRDRGKSFHP